MFPLLFVAQESSEMLPFACVGEFKYLRKELSQVKV